MKKTLLIAMLAFGISGLASAMSNNPDTGYTETKYPIVLVHGLFGFDEILGIDYWYKIPEILMEGGAQVFITQVASANTPEIRGEQLIPQIEEILAITGAEKVNIFGHSHGAPTARYVASVRPELVASVTSIGGVNKGTPFAAIVNDNSGSEDEFSPIIELGDAFVAGLDFISTGGFEQNFRAAFNSISEAETEKFNESHPDGVPTTECGEGDYISNGIHYFSWSGAKAITNLLDPLELVVITASLSFPKDEPNDGAIGVCSSHLGMVIRDDFNMNHLDEINQTLGIHGLGDTDPLTVYRTHANRLKQAGL
jgi:triacylglycerol lipase|tara:strand:- start:216 stop:1148 length:933 start_codon:yes stop_codon:yes gene_type:complete